MKKRYLLLFLSIFILEIVGGIYLYWDFLRGDDSPAAAIGGLSAAIGAVVTAAVMCFTATAASAATKSTEIASQALELSERNNNITAFNQRFSLLLAQHNACLEKVVDYLNKEGKTAFTGIWNSKQHAESFYQLKGHLVISTYMRILYHLLKFIHQDYYDKKSGSIPRKKFSSLVRSVIPNNVLFLIALNASITREGGKDNDYGYYYYQFLLHYFTFFEHALFFSVAKDEFIITQEHITQTEKIDALAEQFFCLMYDYIDNQKPPDHTAITPKLSLVLSWIYHNHLHNETREKLTNLAERFRECSERAHRALSERKDCRKETDALLNTCISQWHVTLAELNSQIVRDDPTAIAPQTAH